MNQLSVLSFDITASGADAAARHASLVDRLETCCDVVFDPVTPSQVRLDLTNDAASAFCDIFPDLGPCASERVQIAHHRVGAVDLGQLQHAVTAVGDHFLQNFTLVRALDVAPLARVQVVGQRFLCCCESLEAINLAALRSVTVAGSHFMRGCSSLRSLDLSGFTHITAIADSFLAYCTALTAIDLSGLVCVKSIGDSFLHGNASLRSLDLSPLASVSTLGIYFLHNCDGLSELDLSPLECVTACGSRFLGCCCALERVRPSRALLGLPESRQVLQHFVAAAAATAARDETNHDHVGQGDVDE